MIILRNDDVNPNTDAKQLEQMYTMIRTLVPDVEIWSCVNFLAKTSSLQSVYPDIPLCNHSMEYFYDIDKLSMRHLDKIDLGTIVSHGLIHANHKHMSVAMQEMSIITSCNYLKTKIFVAPFSGWNSDTERICKFNGITLVKHDGWKSLESENFDPAHKKWYFHSWRFTPESLRKKFEPIFEKVA